MALFAHLCQIAVSPIFKKICNPMQVALSELRRALWSRPSGLQIHQYSELSVKYFGVQAVPPAIIHFQG